MKKENEIFDKYVRSKGLRHTNQRDEIINIFLSTERHVSIEELHKLVRKKDPSIGYTTVYRTMRLLSKCGLCEEVDLGDGIARYEHKFGHKHHDHLICVQCGETIEVVKGQMEKMQDRLALEHSFLPIRHKLEIFGICKRCR